MENGYAITEPQEETHKKFFKESDIKSTDKVTGYIYVLRSLSNNPSIKELNNDDSVSVELLLIKMANSAETRDEILAAAQGFDARTVDYSKESMIFQLTADTRRIDDFVNLMKDYNILEICRTGIVALERGSSTIRKVTNY